MSLINDALRRAKDAQPKAPAPAPGPQFRPVEPVQTPARGLGWMLPTGLILIVLVGVLVFWLIHQQPVPVQAAVAPKPAVATSAVSQSVPPPAPVPAAANSTPTPTPVVAPKPIEQVAVASPAPVIVSNAPPPLRLQAVFYSPGHSSAIISGKTVRAGDKLKGFRVAAITQNSATLVSASETNVMILEDQ